jgi:hypothetical protein
MFNRTLLAVTLAATYSISSMAFAQTSKAVPADHFDMVNWKITLPLDNDKNGKPDEIESPAILTFSDPDFFFLDKNNHLVFEVQNRAITTQGSTNARSELRQMQRGIDVSIDTKAPANNWSLAANEAADTYGSIGGNLSATLKVNHVAKHSKSPEKYPAYSVVVGQIHADTDPAQLEAKSGFGYGNEPLKIFYKKWPGHKMGSVFWTYERNLAKEDPNRIDIAYPVWGNTWENSKEPGAAGIALGEEFSYEVDVVGNIMNLTFKTAKHDTIKYTVDLSTNIDPNGKVDEKDFAQGYAQDDFYFKAGAYGQCSVSTGDSFWATACEGTGDFAADKKTGDYNSVTFSALKLNGK